MPEKPQRSRKRSSGPAIIIVIILLAGALYLGWSYLTGNTPWLDSETGESPKVTWLEKEKKETVIKTETSPAKPDEPPSLHLAPGELQSTVEPPDECLKTVDKILLFFEHLDRQNYIQEYTLKESSLEHINGIIRKLMANPPVVVRETDDLFAILNNMAHFFRVLGPKNIFLIKDILLHERELIEPTMAILYKWSEIEPGCSNKDLDIRLPLEGLYEYAGYFINTLGGQSYLFRRALYLRLLIRYYSILIIDRANNEDANRYGIDIRYTLDALISELQVNTELENRDDYLENLIRLQESYQAKYGGQ